MPSDTWCCAVAMMTTLRTAHFVCDVFKTRAEVAATAAGHTARDLRQARSAIGPYREAVFLADILFNGAMSQLHPVFIARLGSALLWALLHGFAWRSERLGHPQRMALSGTAYSGMNYYDGMVNILAVAALVKEVL